MTAPSPAEKSKGSIDLTHKLHTGHSHLVYAQKARLGNLENALFAS
jgi:hypothetical protein